MRKFDYTFINDLSLPARKFGLMHAILADNESLRVKSDSNPDLFSRLREIAMVESIKGSNAIEGIGTTDERLRGIALRNTEPIGHQEEEIAGYRDVLDLIHRQHADMPFDDVTICGLHRMIYGHCKDREGGLYKTTDNVIVDRTSEGDVIRIAPTSAEDTEAAMAAMVSAYSKAAADPYIESLILIPCVILDFLCIHPFPDGNGRMSRLLTILLLYHSGIDIQRYGSMEAVINSSKNGYYDALKRSSEGWHEGRNDYTPFIFYWLDVMNHCVSDLDRRRIAVGSKRISKTERIERVVLDSVVPISKSEICSILLDVSPSTVEKVLSDMMKEGKIQKIGTSKSARYRKA